MGIFNLRAMREDKEEDSKMKALKSVEETAELLGLSVWTVRAYIRDGKLRPVRLGRRVLLAENELERLVAKSQEQHDPDPNQAGSATVEATR
jgi:excisionase family DNA binding protein